MFLKVFSQKILFTHITIRQIQSSTAEISHVFIALSVSLKIQL